MAYLSAVVIVKASTRLPAELLGGDHALEEGNGRVVGVAELGVEGLDDGQRGVEADEVEQGERPHGEVAAALHGLVDVVAGRNPALQKAYGIVEVREQEGVDDEAGLVLDLDGRLAARLGECP